MSRKLGQSYSINAKKVGGQVRGYYVTSELPSEFQVLVATKSQYPNCPASTMFSNLSNSSAQLAIE